MDGMTIAGIAIAIVGTIILFVLGFWMFGDKKKDRANTARPSGLLPPRPAAHTNSPFISPRRPEPAAATRGRRRRRTTGGNAKTFRHRSRSYFLYDDGFYYDEFGEMLAIELMWALLTEEAQAYYQEEIAKPGFDPDALEPEPVTDVMGVWPESSRHSNWALEPEPAVEERYTPPAPDPEPVRFSEPAPSYDQPSDSGSSDSGGSDSGGDGGSDC